MILLSKMVYKKEKYSYKQKTTNEIFRKELEHLTSINSTAIIYYTGHWKGYYSPEFED